MYGWRKELVRRCKGQGVPVPAALEQQGVTARKEADALAALAAADYA